MLEMTVIPIIIWTDHIVRELCFIVFEEIRRLPNYGPSILFIFFVMFLCHLALDSALLYCRKCFLALSDLFGWTVIQNPARIFRKYHRLKRVAKWFLSSSISTNPKNYFGFLILGCVDMIIFLPIQVLELMSAYQHNKQASTDKIYSGWTTTHSVLGPFPIPRSEWKNMSWVLFSLRCPDVCVPWEIVLSAFWNNSRSSHIL